MSEVRSGQQSCRGLTCGSHDADVDADNVGKTCLTWMLSWGPHNPMWQSDVWGHSKTRVNLIDGPNVVLTSGTQSVLTSGADKLPTSGTHSVPRSGTHSVLTCGADKLPTSGTHSVLASGANRLAT